ncbi:MAG: sensor histidine kinase, partial [Dolichospermum sp.]|nr:sensor histidine kinase [Dolichospermum sp.]
MQTQFWKKLQAEIYFGSGEKLSENIMTIFSLVLISHFLLTWVWSVSIFPAILIVVINCISLIVLYQYNQTIKSGIQARRTMIETTFETIHNGPLQHLAKVLKLVKGQELPINILLPVIEKELEELNQELRGMYEFWQQETLNQDTSLYLGNNVVIDLRNPVHEILYQVYSYTLDRDFPC